MLRLSIFQRFVLLFLFCGSSLLKAEQPIETDPLWSLRPLEQPALPTPDVHPIDAFVDSKLKGHQLQRAPRTDRRSLIRRLSYGLKGLPPTNADLRDFLRASDEDAYQELVERFLASPQYGEHWARHWLDVAQYADTHGNDHDFRRPNAWPYRDYVIKSFNEDKPYARFLKEQVAGDSLYPDSPEATIATGFLAAGPWDDTLMITIRPDTIDHRMGQNLDRDSLVTTVMSTFQSLTVHCARCHDHKFDPISQKDYYALQAVFAGCDRADRPVDSDPNIHAKRARLREFNLSLKRRDRKVLSHLSTLQRESKIAALEEAIAFPRWSLLDVASVRSSVTFDETQFTQEEDQSWYASGKRPGQDTYEIIATSTQPEIRAFRLEVLPDSRLPAGGPGRADNGNFHLAEFRAHLRMPSGEEQQLVFSNAVAKHSDSADLVSLTIDRKADSYWSIHPYYNRTHDAVFALENPTTISKGTQIRISLQFSGKDGHQIGRFRLSATADQLGSNGGLPVRLPDEISNLLEKPNNKLTAEDRDALAFHFLKEDTALQLASMPEPTQLVYAISHDFPKQNGFQPALVPRPIHRLNRGDLNQPRELVAPAALGCLPDLPSELSIKNDTDESSRRAALALWLVDKRNVLTWRSIVNRVWHWHFGQGLSPTPNDFGAMGQAPSHPELLDWLAIWFRDEAKGSFKQLHRLILTSETYRQAVLDAPGHRGQEIDSNNHLLWRMNRQRLTAEQVRDGVMLLSDRLDVTMGGPPVLHFLHKGDETFKNTAPPFVDYSNFDPNSEAGRRRAIYRFIFRTIPDPLLDALGCPDGSGTVPVRATSSSAQQALALLNDNFLLNHAEHMANQIRDRHRGKRTKQVQEAFSLILQRQASANELEQFVTYVAKHGLANACHLLLNTNEFLYLD
jgi:hypothetical protein